MNLFIFILYFLISSLILFFILILIYRFFIRGKCNLVERLAMKQIDDYFNAYDPSPFSSNFDKDDDLEHLDSSDIPMTNENKDTSNSTDKLDFPHFF